MNAQQNNTENDKQDQLTLELLQAIEQTDNISQRHLAQSMGVALGLANSYLKRCVKKGLVKMKTAPANRYLYYLTPKGFAEKARLTGEFLATSLALFRQSGDMYSQLLNHCVQQGYQNIIFAGLSDLTEIAYLRAMKNTDISVVGVFQPDSDKQQFFDLPVQQSMFESEQFDVVIMTSLEQTETLFTLLKQELDPACILLPPMLVDMNYRHQIESQLASQTESTIDEEVETRAVNE